MVIAVDQAWPSGPSNSPHQKGFLHLVAIVAHASRNELSRKLKDSLDTEFGLDALALARENGRKLGSLHTD